MFVVREIPTYYKESGMEDVCFKRISRKLQGNNGRCLVSGRFAYVTKTVRWKVFVIREFII